MEQTALLSGIKLAADAVDKDSFAVMVRVESAMGNFLSIASAPKEVLAACQNPFRKGGGGGVYRSYTSIHHHILALSKTPWSH